MWRPSISYYPGGVGVGNLGFAQYIVALLSRLKNVAQRTLALELTPTNMLSYRKICQYLLYVRLCCAQDDCAVALPGLLLRGVLSETEKQQAAILSSSIPKALQYALSTFGYFKFDGQNIVPLVDILRTTPITSLRCALFSFLVEYVEQYTNTAVPEAERPLVEYIGNILPQFYLAPATHHFNASSIAFWHYPDNVDWERFQAINAGARAQGLNVDDFDITRATGQHAQIVRFPTIDNSFMPQQFYCVRVIDEIEIIRALAVRPGYDDCEGAETLDRFRLSYDRAVLRGYDVPESAIMAVLSELAVR